LAVDAALAATRRRMYVQDGAPEWATPVLYMRSPDGQLFHVERRRLPRWVKATLAMLSVLAGFLMARNWSGEGQELTVARLPSCPPSTALPGLEMVQIPAGRFAMGAKRDDRKPPHEVTLTKPFCIGRYEVTQRQFQSIMGTNPSAHQGDELPVDNVSWGEAQTFLARLNAQEPGYRLLTEAEWEYSARGGTAHGLSAADAKSANCESDAVNDGFDGPAPVGFFAPNPWGLYDMVGNVSEWVADWHSSSYGSGPWRDPAGPASGTRRVRRGGSFAITAVVCNAVQRNSSEPDRRAKDVGFRLARDVSPGPPAAPR
jgi:formylglycine-generating enzyme required for sulfatase activity